MKHFYSFFIIVFATISSNMFAQIKVVMKTPFTDAAEKAPVPFPEYPRPQLQREDWMNLNGKWDYVGGKDVADATTATQPPSFNNAEKITVPYPQVNKINSAVIKSGKELNEHKGL
ncbi:MAG: hypothetical protein ABJA35_17290 [Parafilimonas sp.]